MACEFGELEAKMSKVAIEKSDILYRQLEDSMVLEELRDALRMTQTELAESLNVARPVNGNMPRQCAESYTTKKNRPRS